MSITYKIGVAALLGAAAVAGGFALDSAQASVTQDKPEGIPAIPANTFAHRVTLLRAQRFRLEEQYRYRWQWHGPQVSSGWLVALAVPPDLAYPRQTRCPVLYAGERAVELKNAGWPSGRIVGIVPGDVALEGLRFYYGPPALPEELTLSELERVHDQAISAGVPGQTMEHVAAVVVPELLSLENDYELRQVAIDWVEELSPQETDLIQGARVEYIGGK